jgi:hypothetical protein
MTLQTVERQDAGRLRRSRHTKPGRVIVFALLGIIASGGILLGALFAALHSPWLLSRLALAFGYELSAQTISLSPNLSGSISGLSITSLRDNRLTFLASKITTKTSLDMILRGEIDQLVLQNPKLTFRIGTEQKRQSDVSFLQKMPNVRLLEIHNAEALFSLAGEQQQVRLTGADVTVRHFSPKTGGSITLQTNFTLMSAGAMAIAASGRIAASLQLTGVHPKPYGKGTVEVTINSGTYTRDGQTVHLSDLRVAADMVYERQTETFAITALRGQSNDLGVIEGAAKVTLSGETPWSAHLSVASIDFAQVLPLIKPFLPEEYRAWTTQGQGVVETELQGTYGAGRPSFSGNVIFSFREGGFSSPDGTTAAQGASGKVILKLQYASPEQKLAFNVRWEERDGEYLRGKYYRNLAGQKASLVADGVLSTGGGWGCELSGSLDVLQTGDYTFSARGQRDDWTLHVTIANVSHERIVDIFLKDSLRELSPGLANLAVTGISSLDAVIRRDGAATTIAGTYRMTGATFTAPDMQLAIHGMAADVPFDLVYPSTGRNPSLSPTPGFIRFASIQARRLTIDSLQVPLVIAQNALEVAGPVIIPLFGGKIRLYGVQADDVLFPTRYHFGVAVEGVDLGRLTRRLTGTEYPGRVDADFGHMTYENNRITSAGRAVVRVFGGEIQAANVFVENIASSRRAGGDITFRNINLEEVTRNIAIGKMTGIIQGSLKDFVMEYGQPASFTLEIESVEARGVEQRISMDAIQSISILGTGADSALNQGIARLFKEYPYSKIGLRCVLRNDQFSVNGTIHDGGKEYLVRRGFLRGVDVVNQNPENVISFRDMEERIQRISRRPLAAPVGIQRN